VSEQHTRFEYMYRDGSNYKQYGLAVFAGAITDAERATIRSALERGEYFLAEQVGLPNLREKWETHFEDDHIWHELVDITVVDGPGKPSVEETIHAFADRFAGIEWDVALASATLQVWVASTPAGH